MIRLFAPYPFDMSSSAAIEESEIAIIINLGALIPALDAFWTCRKRARAPTNAMDRAILGLHLMFRSMIKIPQSLR
jgi:hypothetical protein